MTEVSRSLTTHDARRATRNGNRRRRLAHLRIAFVTGRPAYYRLPVFQRLSSRHKVDFLFTGAGGDRYWREEHPESVEGILAFDASSSARLAHRIRSQKYDAVIMSLSGRSHLLSAVAVSRGVPLVLWVGIWAYPRSWIHEAGRPLVRRLLKSAGAIVAYGSHVARWIEDEVGRTEGVIPFWNAVDNAHFRQVDETRARQLRQSVAPRSRTIACFVGRHSPEKGLPDLLEALSLADVDLGLVIVGAGCETETINTMAAEHGVSDRVAILGYVSQCDLPNYYGLGDFLVIPSVSLPTVRETWGLVANEAMNACRPVIATTAVGAAAGGLVQHERTGLVVPERNPEALAAALSRLSVEEKFRLSLGKQARRHVQSWNFDAAVSSFEEALEIATHADSARCT